MAHASSVSDEHCSTSRILSSSSTESSKSYQYQNSQNRSQFPTELQYCTGQSLSSREPSSIFKSVGALRIWPLLFQQFVSRRCSPSCRFKVKYFPWGLDVGECGPLNITVVSPSDSGKLSDAAYRYFFPPCCSSNKNLNSPCMLDRIS